MGRDWVRDWVRGCCCPDGSCSVDSWFSADTMPETLPASFGAIPCKTRRSCGTTPCTLSSLSLAAFAGSGTGDATSALNIRCPW